jgi:TRAP-type uncharacterized transport system substrate-binding protein
VYCAAQFAAVGQNNDVPPSINRQFARTPAGIVLIAVTAVVLLWTLVATLRPLPGRDLAIATGPPGSVYALAAERYRQILAQNHVRLHLVPTNGAVDNARLLEDPKSGVEAGFVQAGTISRSEAKGLVSLGTVFYEELWPFCRCPDPPPPPQEWSGLRISIGPEGGASRPLALELLALNGVDVQKLRPLDYSPERAAQALLAGQIDAALILSPWISPVVQQLARAPQIRLLGAPRADAYAALDPNLTKVTLPRGVADLAADRPPADTPLLASKASLVVRERLHPALQYLLLSAAMEVHSGHGIFQHAGEFPAPEEIDVPISADTRTLYRSGPTFLQRTLPFWLAEFVQRMLILIIPIAGIVYPLWSLGPKLYYWSMRRRLYPMYRELKLLERELLAPATELRATLLKRLEELDRRARDLQMPGMLNESAYNLRTNIRALRQRIDGRP